MAEFKKIVPVLKVSDMQRAVDFYTGVLGFTACWRATNDGGRLGVAAAVTDTQRQARTTR
jgi:catechol 2,3-dioxygenase-like lactoylglutathione lyase family enzyme